MGGPLKHSLMHNAMIERHLGERKIVARAAPLRKPKSQHPPPKRMVSARLALGHTWDQEARFASSTCHHIPLSKEASTTLALRKASLHTSWPPSPRQAFKLSVSLISTPCNCIATIRFATKRHRKRVVLMNHIITHSPEQTKSLTILAVAKKLAN